MSIQQHRVIRLSIPIDEIGFAEPLLTQSLGENKRVRKSVFTRISRILKDAGLISRQDTIRSIAVGLDNLGTINMEVTIQEEPNEED